MFVLDLRGFSWLAAKMQATGFLNTAVSNPDKVVFDDERLKNNVKVLIVNWLGSRWEEGCDRNSLQYSQD